MKNNRVLASSVCLSFLFLIFIGSALKTEPVTQVGQTLGILQQELTVLAAASNGLAKTEPQPKQEVKKTAPSFFEKLKSYWPWAKKEDINELKKITKSTPDVTPAYKSPSHGLMKLLIGGLIVGATYLGAQRKEEKAQAPTTQYSPYNLDIRETGGMPETFTPPTENYANLTYDSPFPSQSIKRISPDSKSNKLNKSVAIYTGKPEQKSPDLPPYELETGQNLRISKLFEEQKEPAPLAIEPKPISKITLDTPIQNKGTRIAKPFFIPTDINNLLQPKDNKKTNHEALKEKTQKKVIEEPEIIPTGMPEKIVIKHNEIQENWAQHDELKEDARQEKTLYMAGDIKALEDFVNQQRDKWFCVEAYKKYLTAKEQESLKSEYTQAMENNHGISELSDKLKDFIGKKKQASIVSSNRIIKKSAQNPPVDPQKIRIVSVSIGEGREFAKLAEKSQRTYAQNKGYTYKIFSEKEALVNGIPRDWRGSDKANNLPEEWLKISAVWQQLQDPKVEWVLWMDDDMYLTNQEKTLESYIEKYGKDNYFIVAKDPSSGLEYDSRHGHIKVDFNNGIFLIKNCPEAKAFLKNTWEYGVDEKGYGLDAQGNKKRDCLLEQQAMTDIYYNDPEVKSHTKILELGEELQSIIRSDEKYDGDKPETKWKDGDFVAHITGASKQFRTKMMKFFDGIYPLPKELRTKIYDSEYMNWWVGKERKTDPDLKK